MMIDKISKYSKALVLCSIILLSGCSNMVLMHPKGAIGLEQRSLILTAISLMMIVVIPAIVMAIIFSIRYRSSNISGKYEPNWSSSNKIELVIWLIPVLIITCLSIITWKSTHALDPSKPLITNTKPITIQVVAMDWKWLFIYPEEGVASINEIIFPANVPIKFEVTSNSVMNSFFIPQLGGQIYAMAGMNSILYLIANKPGAYKGISANFSGQGFSGMKFIATVTPKQHEFQEWIKKAKKSKKKLENIKSYEQLAIPSEHNPVEYFSSVKPNLFQNIIYKFMAIN